MAMAVMPTASATRRMVTASAPSLSSRRRAAWAIFRAVGTAAMYTVYTLESKRQVPAKTGGNLSFEDEHQVGEEQQQMHCAVQHVGAGVGEGEGTQHQR